MDLRHREAHRGWTLGLTSLWRFNKEHICPGFGETHHGWALGLMSHWRFDQEHICSRFGETHQGWTLGLMSLWRFDQEHVCPRFGETHQGRTLGLTSLWRFMTSVYYMHKNNLTKREGISFNSIIWVQVPFIPQVCLVKTSQTQTLIFLFWDKILSRKNSIAPDLVIYQLK